MSASDPQAALAAYLKATSAGDAVSGRVFRPELPAAEDPHMPRACIVIRRAGGYGLTGGSLQPIGDPHLDLFCYGSTWLEADTVASETISALRALTTSTYRATRLYWTRIAGGPNPYEDPRTQYPCMVLTAQVAHYEPTVNTPPPGPPPAPPAPPTGIDRFEYVQTVPATNWTVPHYLGRRPGGVTVYDTNGNEVDTGVRVIDLNTIEITMASPMAGRVVVE